MRTSCAVLVASLASVAACGSDRSTAPTPPRSDAPAGPPASDTRCERAIDHGIELTDQMLTATPSPDDCALLGDDVVRCYLDARTIDDVQTCAGIARRATISRNGAPAHPDCGAARLNALRIMQSSIYADRAPRIAECEASGGRFAECQLEATTALAWAGCGH